MEFSEQDIEIYSDRMRKDFMTKSIVELKKEFSTDRLCWALVMWTYKRIGLIVESEEELKLLASKFHRVRENEQPYKFPDIILFKGDIVTGRIQLARHAGIMLNESRFVHMGRECNGLQFTHLERKPWNKANRMVIRHNEINSP